MNTDWMKDFQPEIIKKTFGESPEQFELRMKSESDIKHIDAMKCFRRPLYHAKFLTRKESTDAESKRHD